MLKHKVLISILYFLLTFSIFSQIKLEQIPSDFDQVTDSLFLGATSSRHIININDNWKVFLADSPENIQEISVPISFNSKETIIFERKIILSDADIIRNSFHLNFFGLNYIAEIFLNNTTLYKHTGGEIPFSIPLPENLLLENEENVIRIKLQYNIDAENTIPLLQRFLFPKNKGGILKDVYLSSTPKVGIQSINYKLENDKKPYIGKLNLKVRLKEFKKLVADSILSNFHGRFKLEASVRKTNDTNNTYYNIWNIKPLKKAESFEKDFFVRLRKLTEWSIKTPISYIVTVKLTNEDGFIFDEYRKEITFLNFTKKAGKLFLNEKEFVIKGVSYIKNSEFLSSYSTIENDIKKIKEAGFNTVRFSKAFPHPYAVHLCKKYGLLAFIELPLNSVPETFTEEANFRDRVNLFLNRTMVYFNKFENVVAYGIGGSYLGNSEIHEKFISDFALRIKTTSPNKLAYASFMGVSQNSYPNLDMYGIELYGKEPFVFIKKFSQDNYSDSLIYFISEATYPTYLGETNGYLNEHSFEGQAKFFDDIITITDESKLKGFVLNSMFDYYGDYAPFFSGQNENNLYNIGILPINDNSSRISYNLIRSRLTGEKKVSVPLGNSKNEAPLLFIIAALLLSVIIALLINSKRKFREDATRALLRPYNFFADIRDQRILSSFHSNILMLLLAGANSLLLTILLNFLKNNILLEKVVIAFGSYKFSSIVNFLAWNPKEAFIYFYISTVLLFLLISLLVHMSSFFVKNKVLFSSVYSVAIWAFLPLALLVPIEAVLFKILQTQSYNYIIYILLILFLVWNIQRFIKGIYVIFDVRPMLVYFYGFLALLFIFTAVGIYFQYTNSVYDYISLAIKQYSLL